MYLHCLFAEDVRQEVNGQKTIVGVYQGGLKVPSLPTILPKFAIHADLFIPIDMLCSDVALKLYMNDALLQSFDVPSGTLVGARESVVAKVADATGYGVQLVLMMQPFEVRQTGRVRLRAVIDGQKEVYGNALFVDSVEATASE